ncbi:MAG: hypothetical protein IJY08_04165 [Clostridia bacterium]|nr:hypothetical protein [Clostridia bacterium]
MKAHLGLTVTTPANLPDECGEVGVTEGWECSVCKKSVASVAVKASKTEHNMVITNTNKQLSCSNTLKYECDCVFDIVDEKGNVYIKDVACKAVDELKCEGIAKEPADERDNTCTVWGYQHFECPKCEQGYIDNFEYATGHNLVEDKTQYVAPDCTTDGKKVAICDVVHTDYDGTTYTCGHVETTVLEKLGHADKDGNVIPCTDADGKPITENVLCFRECCCTCEATVTECPGHLVSWKDLHDWVDTVVAATCVHYQYTLHVCEVCQYDYTTTTFIKGDHNYTGAYKTKVVNGKTEFVLDANGKKVPDVNYNNIPMGTVSKASWYIAKAEDKASYTKAGVMTFDCKNAGCKVSITEEYVLTDVNLTVSIDSAVKASAKLVNSGKMAVTIKANAYKVDLRSIYFELPYDTAKFTYSNAKIETTLFGDSGFAVGAKDGVVAVQMTNPGNIDNITLNGTDVALITLYFDIKNTVVQNDSVTDFSMNVKNTSVIKVENAKNVAVDSTIGKAAASKVYVLGNVTGGTIEAFAAKKYADDYDVVALIDILMAGKYDAVADMNKDGKVDAKDYAALGKYVVNAITYDDLCKTAK